MKIRTFYPVLWSILFILVVGLACNFGPTDTTETSEPPLPTKGPIRTVEEQESPAETEAPPDATGPGAINSLQDVKQAVIQIEAQGTFVDPQFGLIVNGAGRGSGFIIDPEGIAVTNNHVVTGAALLKVWVGGESEPRNARLLGVSECSDLAVIDIEGSDFRYLDWFEGPIDVGMDMYIAGFPLGDPEYTLNKGIISKAKADGETSWSSVDSVLEYDATSNPGNSGGPVVTPDGEVLAVHYAGNANTRQAFGISRDVAREMIDILREGRDVDTIGINGQAVGTEDGSLTGIWVSSVQSGSPADEAGVQAGDIITMMENLVLATDGTMEQYCDIIRTHSLEDVLALQVLRWTSGEVLEGQLNGRELAVVATSGGETGGESTGETASASESTYLNLNASEPGDIILSTEFDDTENWYTFAVPDSDNYEVSYDNSLVYIQVDDTDSTVYMLYDLDMPADIRLDAAVETVAGPNRNNISLICRATQDGWYEFSMNSGGYWFIWKYENEQYTELARGASNAINLQKRANELTATCIGKELTFYVNQVEMGSVIDNRFKGEGHTGISVSAFDIPGAGVEFDWYVASIP